MVQQKATVMIFKIGLFLKVKFWTIGIVYKTVTKAVIVTIICFEIDRLKNKQSAMISANDAFKKIFLTKKILACFLILATHKI